MEATTYAPPPQRFEAGTQPVAQAVAMGAAADYLLELGMDHVAAHEVALTRALLEAVDLPGVRDTVSIDHIKRGYYSIKALNPTGIVPVGPALPDILPALPVSQGELA